MPWRGDFVKAFWINPDYVGLSGYPGQEDAPKGAPPGQATPTPPAAPIPFSEQLRSRVETINTTFKTAERPQAPIQYAVITLRDRIGFEYERVLGLDDFVSVRDAANLLSLPVMTVNRWVRAKKVKSSRRRGFAVIPLREVLRVAEEKVGKLRFGSQIKIMG
jgi:hypothetical protein